ncbi:RNA-directed DNA polymerase, eukaryota [Tanacetum coccineum]
MTTLMVRYQTSVLLGMISIHKSKPWLLKGLKSKKEERIGFEEVEASVKKSNIDEENLDLGERNVEQYKRMICDGHYTTAVRVLSSPGVSPYIDATLEDLKAKHPFKPAPSLSRIPIDPHYLIAPPTVVLDLIKSFPRGTSYVRYSLCAQHLLGCLGGAVVGISDELAFFITQVVNLFLDGKCPKMLGEYIASASLTPLVKAGGGIRPIAMDTVCRHFVSKVSVALIGHSLDDYLNDIQFGVGISGGGEAILHVVNCFIEDRRDDVGLSMLLVDFKNAFNLVDRGVMLQEVRLCSLGDPLGPLLFALVLHPLICKIRDSFILSLQAWYLNDGTIIRDTLVVGKLIVTASGHGFGDWQWRLATFPFAFGGLYVYSAGDVLNCAFLMSRLQSASLQTKLLRHSGIVASGTTFEDALCGFNSKMEIELLKDHTSDWLKVVPIFGLGQTMNGGTYRCVLCYRLTILLFSVLKSCSACSRVFPGDIYGDHVVSCVGIIEIKHHHNVVRDALVDICFWSGISAGKEVDIGLSEGGDKPLRPADILLYSWDGGLDVCVDLTRSSPLTQIGMVGFVPSCAVIDASQRKRVKYETKCAYTSYGFLPFPFSSFGELEKDEAVLLKRIHYGTIIEDTLVVGKILELIMEDGPRCGLHLNVDKTEVYWPKEDPRSRLAGVFPPNIIRPLRDVKLLGGRVSVDSEFSSELVSISKSIFVTNFPDVTSAKELWRVCQTYGIVIDMFIPNRLSRAGKRFAFVRFIRVENVDRLVGNLCTLWIGRMHLQANVARFERPSVASPRDHTTVVRDPRPLQSKSSGSASFVSVLQGNGCPSPYISLLHAMVLDDACLVERDLENFVMGGLWVMFELKSKVSKEKLLDHVGVSSWFHQICSAQLDFVAKERIVWIDIEGVPLHAWSRATFTKICSRWGEVMELEENKVDFFARKRICIKTKTEDNILEKFKVVLRGKVFVIRVKELFVWSPVFKEVDDEGYCSDVESSKEGESVKGEPRQFGKQDNDSDEEEVVSETCFGDETDKVVGDTDIEQPVNESKLSSDPFDIYGLLRKQGADNIDKRVDNDQSQGADSAAKTVENEHELSGNVADSSIPFPPGFTPPTPKDASIEQEVFDSGAVRWYRSISKKGGSILELLDDVVKVRQAMGFSMVGCEKDIEGLGSKAKKDWIRELLVKYRVNFLSLQETKGSTVSDMDVKMFWGNSCFEYTFSEALGLSGGIISVWDPSVFHFENHTVSDNFITLYGLWKPTKTKLLVISVYAPQALSEKRTL